MDYIDQHFEGTTVVLDGNSYTRCTFVDVVFQYSGGPLNMEGCGMDRFSFRFDGDLSRGLWSLWQLFGTEGMLSILRGFTQPHDGEVTLPPA